MPARVIAVALVALVVAGVAAYMLRAPRGVPEGAPTEADMAAEIGAPVMRHLWRGHVPGRSGEIMLVPRPHNFLIGEWDLRTLGTSEPTTSTSHPNPWDYLARVPIILYGRPFVPEGRVSDEEVDISALAPTYASLLGMDGFEAEGEALQEVAGAARPPRAIVTVVIDGGGWNALQEHPDSWPVIAGLRKRGLTYVNATIGSAPSITGALHATFGTGSYPLTHGIPGNQMRAPDGTNTDTWRDEADPRYLEVPTVSELWDEANDNEPFVGTVSYEGWHLGMIGHGAQREGGDRDVAVLWHPETNEWWTNEDYYELPEYLQTTDLDRLESYEQDLDARDGLVGDGWFGRSLEELQEDLTRPGTPAFVRFTGDALIDVLRRERVGRDDLTDLFWVEMKMPDYAGHAWNMEGREQADVIRETDRQIGRIKRLLDAQVGRGRYVLAISADHGQQPLPDLHGGWRINSKELQRDIEARFGNVVEKVTPVDVYVDRDAVEEEGIAIADIARFVGTYTLGDNIRDGAPGAERVPTGRLDELLFAGAFSSGYLGGLDEETIAGFGQGVYPEGDFLLDDEGDG